MWRCTALLVAASAVSVLGLGRQIPAPARSPAFGQSIPSEVVHGSGAVSLPPGESVGLVPDLPASAPGSQPSPILTPSGSVLVSNGSDQTASVVYDGGSVGIAVPDTAAIILEESPSSPLLWRFCQYGSDPLGRAAAAPANHVACIASGPALLGSFSFTTVSWSAARPMVQRVAYAAGWNLVAAPEGTTLAAIDAEGRPAGVTTRLYTLQTSDATYESLPASTNLRVGTGYWAYFDRAATVSLLTSGPQTLDIDIPPSRFVMIGNPGEAPVTVTGADVVYIYDPASGQYEQMTTLQPGQGAWAYSAAGATISLTPTGAP